MKGDWADYTVEQIAAKSPYALATGPFGSSIGSRFFQTEGIPVIRGGNLSQDVGIKLIDADWVFVSREKAAQFSRSIVRSGDLVFTCWGTIDQIGLIDETSPYPEYVISNKQMKLTPNATRFDSHFLYYLFKSPGIRDVILSRGIGSSVPGFNLGQLRRMRISAPPLATQKAIANVLRALDDKIRLNRKMNLVLEALASALFKSWFVDFDAVTAKRDGKTPVGVPVDALDLFPGHFEDSELGPIPKGWTMGRLCEITAVVDCLHSKKPERQKTGRPLLQLDNIADAGLMDLSDLYLVSDQDYTRWSERIEASPGDCVITNVGRVGAVGQIPQGFRAALGRNMTGLRSIIGTPTFLIECLLSTAMREEIEKKTDAGTILEALNVSALPGLRFVRPPSALILLFEGLCRPFRSLMESHVEHNSLLSSLRDTVLLPLLSGEISIKTAEKTVAEVV